MPPVRLQRKNSAIPYWYHLLSIFFNTLWFYNKLKHFPLFYPYFISITQVIAIDFQFQVSVQRGIKKNNLKKHTQKWYIAFVQIVNTRSTVDALLIIIAMFISSLIKTFKIFQLLHDFER